MVFFILFIVALVILFNIGKKKKPTPLQYNKPTPVRHLPHDIKPNPTSLKLANEHFGTDWQKFIQSKSVSLVITNQRIREKIAFCYEKLQHKDLQQLLISFIQPNSHMCNYSALHQGVYKLIVTSKFHDGEIIGLLNQLVIEHKRKLLINNNIATNPVIIQNNSNPIVIKHPQAPVDTSIIEIPSTPVKIETIVNSSIISSTGSQSNEAYNPEDYKLGTKYKEKLKLSPQEVIWLNKFYDYNNTFNSIDGCSIAIIKLYLLSIKLIVRRLANESYSLSQRIDAIKEAIYRFEIKQPGYWSGYDYTHHKETAESDLYYTLYKKAEAAVRNAWDHKRKISADYPSRCTEAFDLFKKNMEPVIDDVINYLLPTIVDPDDKTEALLNAANHARWKTRFEKLTNDYKTTETNTLVENIHTLGRQNRKNPAVENIYYEAAKFFVSVDKTEALKFYLHYIYKDLKSSKFDNKPLNKTLQKTLFKTDEQLQDFQAIINDLISSKNLEKALSAIPSIYKTKRKAIVLNTEAIKRVQLQHTGTVEILNEYLNDEDELIEPMLPLNTSAPPNILVASDLVQELTVDYNGISLNKTQLSFLELFKNSSFNVASSEIEHFAKNNNIFKNQFIDSINDSCYERLDDVLIEEDEDSYQINPDYYKQIFS